MNEFLIYCNTKQLFTNNRNGDEFVHDFYLSNDELKRWHVTRPQVECMPEIIKIVDSNSNKTLYRVQGVSEIDVSLIKRRGQPLTDLHQWMLKRVCETDLPTDIETTPYWQLFIQHRESYPGLFFTVDDFAGRVHTPVSNTHRTDRPKLLLRNEPTVSFDVAQMQPTLLGKVLQQAVGKNSYSDAINEGKDIYVMLQTTAGLATRDEAKKRFYKITFGWPNDKLALMFNGEAWINWINEYKQAREPRNPHNKEKPHSNLAWLLQNYEVQIMGEVWRLLAENALPFLTVHDEIICRATDAKQVETIFNKVLSNHFATYKISMK